MVPSFWPRFQAKYTVDSATGCWKWHGADGRGGYGIFKLGPKLQMAHRVAFEYLRGPIPEGLQLDHLCRNPACVNPDHLEIVTPKENIRRGTIAEAAKRRGAEVTHCPKGHPYSGENLYVKPNGRRECRQCVRDASARYREKKGTAGKTPRKSSLGQYPRKPVVAERKPYTD